MFLVLATLSAVLAQQPEVHAAPPDPAPQCPQVILVLDDGTEILGMASTPTPEGVLFTPCAGDAFPVASVFMKAVRPVESPVPAPSPPTATSGGWSGTQPDAPPTGSEQTAAPPNPSALRVPAATNS